MMAFPDCFATPRLRAERLREEHLDAIRAMDTDARYMALLGGTRDLAQTAAYMAKNLQHWSDHGFGVWVLRDEHWQRVVGRGVLRHVDVEGTDEVELGYGFHPQYWGHGLGTEIARKLLRIGHTELRLATLVALTRYANIASQRVLTKTGLVYERDITYDGVLHMLYRSL